LNRLSPSSLRLRLLLLVLLAVIPALGLMIYSASADRQAAAEEARADALRVANDAARRQADLLEQARLMLVDLRGMPQLAPDRPTTCQYLFIPLRARYLQAYPRYGNLGVVDPSGQITCSVDTVVGPSDLAGRTDFETAMATLDFTVGEAVADPAGARAYVYLFYPVLDFDGSVRALLFAALDLQWLQELVAGSDLPPGSVVTVVNQAGQVLARNPDPDGWVGGPLPDERLAAAFEDLPAGGTTELTGLDGQPRLYAVASLLRAGSSAAADLMVSVGIPAEAIFAPAQQALARNLLALSLVAGMALAVSVAGSEWMVRPVHDLLAATRRLAAGDLKARTQLRERRSVAELAHLAEAFDQMAETLEQREARRQQAEAELRQSEERYRTLAQNFPNGAVILFDHDLRYVLADGAGLAAVGLSKEMLEGHTIWEVFPRAVVAQIEAPYRAALAGQANSSEVEFAGRVYLVHTLPLTNARGEIFAAMAVTQDITERKHAFELLERRVAERTHQLSTLLRSARNVTMTLDVQAVLGMILDELGSVVSYAAASIVALEGGLFQTVAYRGPVPIEEALHIRFAARESLEQRVMATGRPLIIDDLRGDSPLAVDFRARVGDRFERHYPSMRSWLRVPMFSRQRLIGLLTLQHGEPGYYSEREAELALAFADQASVALENARLFAAERRRAEQFRLINEVGHHIASILSVDETLRQTVHSIREAFGYDHVHVGLLEGDHVVFRDAAGVYGDEPNCVYCARLQLRVGRDGVSGWVAERGEPYLVPDVTQEPRYLRAIPGSVGSELVLPVKLKGQVIGILDVESSALNAFDETDVTVLQALASQLAVAIENARLYEQARQLAALEERQKLARELHDSVSQALYGIALGARTARTLLERDPSRLGEPLDYVLSLAEAGLTEMRALIFELRPESLENEGLLAALTKQAEALKVRHRLDVRTQFPPNEPDLPLNVKEALYRIAQEALHNIAKHARATRVDLALRPANGAWQLEVADDGVGFDPAGDFPGHLGLKSMRERAERLGGAAEFQSAPGQGTKLCVQLPTKSSE
jgi:PAS domain S-box-containing protein